MKVLVFDIYGDFAHFRKYYTTTSPLTFSFPPPPTIAGILGAIYGASKDEYLNLFNGEDCKIALKILSPISKIRFGINLVNTKDNKSFRLIKTKTHEPRTQIRTEFVKNPKYRIYMVHNNPEIFEKLRDFIENHKSYYTVSLGLSELIANFNYVGTFDYVEITQENEALYIDSIIPAEKVKEKGIVFEPNKKYFKEKIPGKMTTERIVEKYVDVIYEPEGKPILAKVEKAFRLLNGETVIFL